MYAQITVAERYTIGILRRLGHSAAAIARDLGRHRSTIGREVHRNATHHDGSYRPQLADWYARGRRSHARRNQRFSAADWALVHARLRRTSRSMVLRCRPRTRAIAAGESPRCRSRPRVYLSAKVIWRYMAAFILLEEN